MRKKYKRGAYTAAEFSKLWKLKNAGVPTTRIAIMLGRSVSSVSAVIRRTYDYMRTT